MAESRPERNKNKKRKVSEQPLDAAQLRTEWSEQRQRFAERAKARIEEYVAIFFSVKKSDQNFLNKSTQHVVIEQEGKESRTASYGFSEKKSMKPWDDKAYDEYVEAQWEWRERLKEERAFTD